MKAARAGALHVAGGEQPVLERNRPMSSVSKLAALTLETEVLGSKEREVPFFAESSLPRWDARPADDPSAQLSGRDRLTARERDVLAMISQGLSNKRVARALEISPETVKSHVKHIFLKLAVGTRAEAVSRALSLELAGNNFSSGSDELFAA
jgi:DNA-binding CsgD family transcriptional regulator